METFKYILMVCGAAMLHYYCGGYISPNVASSKEVQCTLWDGGIVVEDDSFCYRADIRKRLHDDIHRKD